MLVEKLTIVLLSLLLLAKLRDIISLIHSYDCTIFEESIMVSSYYLIFNSVLGSYFFDISTIFLFLIKNGDFLPIENITLPLI